MNQPTDPLKLYIYAAGRDNFVFPLKDAFVPMFARGKLPPEFTVVATPTEADFIVLPFELGKLVNAVGIQLTAQYLRTLPFFATHAEKHVYFLRHDDSRPLGVPGVIFRVGTNRFHRDPLTVALPYQTDDFGALADADFAALPYDTAFVGYIGLTDLRPMMAASVRAESSLAAKIVLRDIFFGHVGRHQTPEMQAAYRAEYRQSLADARTVLCPRGEGEGSIRFFEAMSAGRVPILLADEHELPFADQIDYDAFTLRIPQADAEHTGEILAAWLANHPPEKLQQMGKMARQAWEQYITPAKFAQQVHRYLNRIKTEMPRAPMIARSSEKPSRQPATTELQYLYARAAELPRHSTALAVVGDDRLPLLTLAQAFADTDNTDSRVLALPLPRSPLGKLPAIAAEFVSILPPYSVESRAQVRVRSVDLFYFSDIFTADDTQALLREWYPTLGFGGIFIGIDRTPNRTVWRAAETFCRELGWFTPHIALQTTKYTLFELEFNAVAVFKKTFGFQSAPMYPLPAVSAPVVRQLNFAGDVPPAHHPRVSLCMIVKNEEANLANCLRSVGDFPAEIIVVDTGSTDRTVEIAESFGAKVFHFDWIDDFAAARNESLRHATGDWIFWLDADDRVPPRSLVQLKQAVASGRADAFRCRMVSPLNGDTPAVNVALYTLLFRNYRGVQFEGAIHETPTDSAVRQGLTLANTNITIEHHGYTGDAAQLRQKAERNARILRRCVAAEPDSLKWRYHLGVSLYQMEDYVGAAAQFEPIVAHPAPPLNEHNQVYRAHLLLLSAYANTNQPARADAVLARALERYPRRRHLLVAAGMFRLHQNRPADAVSLLERARLLPPATAEGEDWQPGVLEAQLAAAHHAVGAEAFQRGDFLSAAEAFQQEITVARQPAQIAEAWKLTALCLQKLGQETEAMTAWKMSQQVAKTM